MHRHCGHIIGFHDSLTVIACDSCGFYHLDPIPDSLMYANGAYYSQVKPQAELEMNEDARWWQAIYGDWLAMIESLVPSKYLLDVGAGTGAFVREAQRLGWLAQGIEADYNMARAHNLTHGDYYSVRDRFLGLGIITAHWVIEHLNDPAHFLEWAYYHLEPEGVLLVTIPNDFRPIQFEAADKAKQPFYWIHETHTNYWNKTSMTKFLDRCDFRVLDSKCYGSWQPEKFIIDGQNYLVDHNLGRQLHSQRKSKELEMGRKSRRALMRMRGLLGWGRDITVTAVKK